jgi:hypothetical protein
LNDLKEDSYNFGPITSPNSGDIVTLTYSVEPAEGNSYFKVDQSTGRFSVTNRNGLLSSTVSLYKIKLFLEDSNITNPSNKTYLVNFDIKDAKYSSKEKPKNNSKTIG